MTIKANIKRLDDAYQAVRGHCMCAKLEDDGVYIRVIYPAGDWPNQVQGVQCSYGGQICKAEALERIAARMESDWINSYPGKV